MNSISQDYNNIINNFSNFRVMIIGDVMLDAYVWGDVKRISPEAPVPVLNVNGKEERLGGAANVALNVRSLGADTIVCSVLGKDEQGKRFKKISEENGIELCNVETNDRPTPLKTRIIGGNQQVIRVDEESSEPLSNETHSNLLHKVCEKIDEGVDLIIFQDYDKGVLNGDFIETVVQKAKEREVIVTADPKKKNFFSYKNVNLFKPNLKELSEGLNKEINIETGDSLEKAVELLREKMNHELTLVSLSSKGIYYKNEKEEKVIPAHVRQVSDVSGAGDTVISVASLALVAGATNEQLTELANLAGGLVCEELGVVPVKIDKLREEISLFNKT